MGRQPGHPRLKLDHDLLILITVNTLVRQAGPTITDVAPNLEVRRQRSKQLALAAARTAEDNRGQNIVVLDMRSMTTEFDYFVLVTGNSRRQLHAISEEIDRVLEIDMSDRRMGIEGYNESRWILLDYGSVVIHMFDAETRDYYALEDLWGQAKRVPLPWQAKPEGETGRRGDGETPSQS
jgi:ribosome-associated protein